MLNFCTLFDSNYLSRGLAMYNSLAKRCFNFHIYIFAFDEISFDVLKKMELPETTIIPLSEFENNELLGVKPGRSRAEYCWTCTSSTILYCIENFKLDHCTYVDADLFFYNDPAILLEEMGDKDVLITEHDFSEENIFLDEYGKYCVQFMTFKNTKNGIEILKWWKNACIEWCFNRLENNKFGDQKYLDDWTTRFDCVHELQNEAGKLAPWNIQKYKIKSKNSLIFENLRTRETVKPVFYHFHSLSFYSKGLIELANECFFISRQIKRWLYYPYIRNIININKGLNKDYTDIDFNGTKEKDITIYHLRDKLYLYKKALIALSIKKLNDANKLIKEQQQSLRNFIQNGSIN